MQTVSISPSTVVVGTLKTYVFLNLFKPLLGIFLGREMLTAGSMLLSLSLFAYFFATDLVQKQIKRSKVFALMLIVLFSLQLALSVLLLRGADVYPAVASFFQVITPMLFLYLLESVQHRDVLQLGSFLKNCLIPVIVFAFVELLLPLSVRKSIYLTYSFWATGEANIDVAYYLGDTEYAGLRLGSIFFEPLTFAFVSSFLTIYLFSSKRKGAKWTLLANLMSLGKLPIATTLIALLGNFFRKIYRLYYFFLVLVVVGVLAYFVKNAEVIALTSPSLGSHMLGLAYGLINGMENPLVGHGFGTAGYLSYTYYLKQGVAGPFKNGTGGLMNGNESAVGVLAYQLGFVCLGLFLWFFVVYIKRLARARQIMMSSAVIGLMLSFFLSESILSITVISVLLIFSKCLIIESEKKEFGNY